MVLKALDQSAWSALLSAEDLTHKFALVRDERFDCPGSGGFSEPKATVAYQHLMPKSEL